MARDWMTAMETKAEGTDQVINELARRFQERDLPHLWFLTDESRPADLEQRLRAHGWMRLPDGALDPYTRAQCASAQTRRA